MVYFYYSWIIEGIKKSTWCHHQRNDGGIRKLAAYVIFGIKCDVKKEVITIQVGKNESSKYWLSVPNRLKDQGVKDFLIICVDGLSGIKETLFSSFSIN